MTMVSEIRFLYQKIRYGWLANFHLGKTKLVSEKSSCFLSNERRKKFITTVTFRVKQAYQLQRPTKLLLTCCHVCLTKNNDCETDRFSLCFLWTVIWGQSNWRLTNQRKLIRRKNYWRTQTFAKIKGLINVRCE